jgi:lysozyme
MRLRTPASRLASGFVLLPLLSASAVSASVTIDTPLAAAATPSTTVIDGPDVSSYQHPNGAAISWPAVRKSGREFVIVKATEGPGYVNPWFARDYAGVAAAAMVRGSYHFARPARPIAATARQQAAFYVSRLGSLTASRTLPPTLDLEVSGGLSKAELIVWAQDFLLEARRLTGRTPLLYTYPYFWQHSIGDPAALARYPLWMATYSGPVDPSATLWQYTASATVAGIRGGVDMSRLISSGSWPSLADGSQPTPWPATVPGQVQHIVATAGVRSASVSWLPGDAGTSALTGYDVRVVETGQQVTVGPTATRAAVSGLTTGRGYTLTVTPRNLVGAGVSATSGQVVPVTPTSFGVTASASSIYVGGSVTYVGTVRNRDTGEPLVGVGVQVFSRPLGSAAWGLVQRLTTDDAGQVSITRSPTRSTQLRMYFPGAPAVQPAATLTTTLVRTHVTAGLSHAVAAVGVPVFLSGAISPRFAGVIVARQVWARGAWHTVATTTTRGGGAYAFRVTPRGRSTTRMRAVVAATRGRAPGYSPDTTLWVH